MNRATVEIAPDAERDLGSIRSWQESEWGRRAALTWARAFRRALFVMESHPAIGRLDPDLGDAVRRYLVEPYVVIYDEPGAGRVRVLRVVHGARDLPTVLRED